MTTVRHAVLQSVRLAAMGRVGVVGSSSTKTTCHEALFYHKIHIFEANVKFLFFKNGS